MAERPMPYGFYADESTVREPSFSAPPTTRTTVEIERQLPAPAVLPTSRDEPSKITLPGSNTRGGTVVQPTVAIVPTTRGAEAVPGQPDRGHFVEKLMHFFLTLLQRCDNADKTRDEPVRESLVEQAKTLILQLITGRKEPEEFASELQRILRSNATPSFVPFIRLTLPHFVQAAARGRVNINILIPNHMRRARRGTHSSNAGRLHGPRPVNPAQVDCNPPVQDTSEEPPQRTPTTDLPSPPSPAHPAVQPIAEKSEGGIIVYRMKPPEVDPLLPKGWDGAGHSDAKSAVVATENKNDQKDLLPEGSEVVRYDTIPTGVLQDSLIHPYTLLEKIKRNMKISCSVEEEALMIMSDAAEHRIRGIIENLVTFVGRDQNELAAVDEEEYARLIQKSAEKHEKPDELKGNTHDDDNLNGDKNDEPHCDKTEKMEVSPHYDDSPNGGDKSDEPHCDETEQKEVEEMPTSSDQAVSVEDVNASPNTHGTEAQKENFCIETKNNAPIPEGTKRVKRNRITMESLHVFLREDPLFKGTKVRLNFAAGYLPSHE